jgi:hypothetical protein
MHWVSVGQTRSCSKINLVAGLSLSVCLRDPEICLRDLDALSNFFGFAKFKEHGSLMVLC